MTRLPMRLLVLLLVFGAIAYILLRTLQRLRPQPFHRKRTDPYTILGISPEASETDIKEAYHRELANYHPDKVAHLGEELQAVAQAKTAEIIQAYESISKRRSH